MKNWMFKTLAYRGAFSVVSDRADHDLDGDGSHTSDHRADRRQSGGSPDDAVDADDGTTDGSDHHLHHRANRTGHHSDQPADGSNSAPDSYHRNDATAIATQATQIGTLTAQQVEAQATAAAAFYADSDHRSADQIHPAEPVWLRIAGWPGWSGRIRWSRRPGRSWRPTRAS